MVDRSDGGYESDVRRIIGNENGNETGPVHFQFLGYVLQSNHFIESKHAVCWWCQCRRSTVGVLSCAGEARKVNARRWKWKVERAEAKSEE